MIKKASVLTTDDFENPMQTIAAGYVIDAKFKILSQLGMGGLGTVYKAEQADLNRIVAIKVLHDKILDGDEMSLRFEREAKVLASLKHRHIVEVFAFGSVSPSMPYMAMEFVDGQSLDSIIKKEVDEFNWKRVLKIAIQVCEGLSFAHSMGIIHRDIKPQNIMIETGPNGDVAKILDFGLSRVLDERESIQHLTTTGALIGSVHYMSPELCMGKKADERSDIYALGCTLYEALSGKPPLDSENPMSIINKHLSEMPRLLRDSGALRAAKIPVELDLAVFKTLQKDPSERFQTMHEFSHALKAILDGRTEDLDFKDLQRKSSAGEKKGKALLSLLLTGLGFISIVFLIAFANHKKAVSHDPLAAARISLQEKAESYLKEGLKLKQGGRQREAEVFARRALITIAKPFPPELRSADYSTKDLSILQKGADIITGCKRPQANLSEKVLGTIYDNDKLYLSHSQLLPFHKSFALIRSLYLSAHDSSGEFFEAIRECLALKDERACKEILKQYELCAKHESTQDESMRQSYLELGRAYLSAIENDKEGIEEHCQRAIQISKERKIAENNCLGFLREMGRLHADLHDYSRAEKELLEAFQIAAKCEGGYFGLTSEVASQLEKIYKEQDQPEKADAIMEKALKIQQAAKRGPDALHSVIDQQNKRLKSLPEP